MLNLIGLLMQSKKEWPRPPGAKENFLEFCTACADCIKACPHFSIRKAGEELGKKISSTPIIIPKENPCLMCSDFPCIQVCETGALQLLEQKTYTIGLAAVRDHCYMNQNQPCDYCMVHCPTKPKAITVNALGQMPMILSDHCTGCGECAQICPTDAIHIHDRRGVL